MSRDPGPAAQARLAPRHRLRSSQVSGSAVEGKGPQSHGPAHTGRLSKEGKAPGAARCPAHPAPPPGADLCRHPSWDLTVLADPTSSSGTEHPPTQATGAAPQSQPARRTRQVPLGRPLWPGPHGLCPSPGAPCPRPLSHFRSPAPGSLDTLTADPEPPDKGTAPLPRPCTSLGLCASPHPACPQAPSMSRPPGPLPHLPAPSHVHLASHTGVQ